MHMLSGPILNDSHAVQRVVSPAIFDSVEASKLQPPCIPGTLTRLRAVVLLAGALRTTVLRSGIGRSVLDLPVEHGVSILDLWRIQSIELAVQIRQRLPVRLVLDKNSPLPALAWPTDPHVSLIVERDPLEFRGTGGIVADLSRQFDPDDFILIANAAQIQLAGLTSLISELASVGTDVTIVSHPDGTPSGLTLARCDCFRDIPPTGFIDLKEQALPAIARTREVGVLEKDPAPTFAIRTHGDYTQALRRYHTRSSDQSTTEDWQPAFSLIEPQANVAPSARIHDSVVLRGARVEDGAVIVRSVVCPGAIVKRGVMAVDQFLSPAGRLQKVR